MPSLFWRPKSISSRSARADAVDSRYVFDFASNLRGHREATRTGRYYYSGPYLRGADVAATCSGIIAICQKVSKNLARNSVGAAFLAGFLVAFEPAANATIDVPTKAVWSVTDIDSLQFCAKCNPDDVTSSTRTENYKKTIIDTVAMGARQILVHARPGAARATRLGEFASALAAYNATASAADKACMAVMYADYGTAHTDSEITALYTTAWNTSGANYCSSAGRPVVATLSDRSDETCAPARFTNIVNRLRTLPSGTAPTALHWVAAFGERSEYGDWNSACRDKISGPGIPITYSYLEMANDDPAFATDAAARRDSVKAAGGRYILGLPSASAQNCGDFCGADADSTTVRHTDFGGFNRLLAAWRAGTDNVAYTFGPGGPYGKDQFASSAVRCDANDLITTTAECQAIAAADAPLVPGVPTSGTAVEPPPPPPPSGTGQCASSTVPQQAKDQGLTYLAFCDDFSKDSINSNGATWNVVPHSGAAGSGTGSHTSDIKWSSWVAFGGSSASAHLQDSAIKWNGDGTVTIDPNHETYQWYMSSVGQDGKGFVIKEKKRFYIEIRWRFDKAGGGQPAFWMMDLCHTNSVGTCENNKFLEPDIWEYHYQVQTMHRHIHEPFSAQEMCTRQGAGQPLGQFFTAGMLYTGGSTSAAKVSYYWKDAVSGVIPTTDTNCYSRNGSSRSSAFVSEMGGGVYPLLIGSKYGDVITYDYVRVWMHPADVQ